MKRLPLSLWIVIEIILILAAFNGYKYAGYIALINIGLLIFSIVKAYIENRDSSTDYNENKEIVNTFNNIMDKYTRKYIKALGETSYSNEKMNALEELFKICYAPDNLFITAYENSFSKIQDEYGNHYSFDSVKTMVMYQYEKAYKDMNDGINMSQNAKETILKIKSFLDGGNYDEIFKIAEQKK